uniref:ZP domain-containing protein n=1 Tax=Schistosoma mansoni TaxID=6183 RepID=A0A3Q0KSB0_SCHMA
MNISLENLMFITVVIYVILNGIHGQSYQPVNFEPLSTGRRLLYSDWESAPSFYSPGGITPDNEPRAPIYMELTNNLTSVNGASGICGVCARIYRVLHMTQLNAAEECRRHHNSRQAAFGDITEFYHTLVKSRRLNGTIEFPLADKFSRFTFRTTILYLASRENEPGLMIEAGSETKYVLCVQSIKCPEPITTTTTEPITTTTPLTTISTVLNTSDNLSILSSSHSPSRAASNSFGNRNDERSSSVFWDTLLSGTEPKDWFLATVSLSCLCLLLIIILIITWLYICRIRRLYSRRRCQGTCRFGCRCPPEVVRQMAAEAAVCGPLGLQTHQPFVNAMSPHGNGSVRSGSGYGNTLYTGGTLNSGGWGSNGNKIGSPLYVALSSGADKATLLSAGCNTPNCMLEMSGGLQLTNTADGSSGTWNQTSGKFRNPRLRPKRSTQDALRRSTSEGSSVSGVTGTAGANNSATGIEQANFVYRPGPVVSFSDATISNILPAMVVSNTNAGQHGTESTATAYLQACPNGYNYSDSGRGSGISPGYSHSPTHMNNRKVKDGTYFNNSNNDNVVNANNNNPNNIQNGFINSNSPINMDEVESRCDMSYLGNQANKILSSLQSDHCTNFNGFSSDSRNIAMHHLNRDSEGDFLNITPPSGFYDFNNNTNNNNSNDVIVNSDSGYLANSSRQQSQTFHQNRLITSPNSFGRQMFNQLSPSIVVPPSQSFINSSYINDSITTTSSLYPSSQTEWHNTTLSLDKFNLQNGEMIGSLDDEYINGYSTEVSNTGTASRMRKYITSNYNNGNGVGGTRPLVPRPHFSDSLHSAVNYHQNSYANESNSVTVNNRSLHNSNDTTTLNGILSSSSKIDHLCTTLTSERML